MTIGLDIGGSKIRGVLWNGKKILRKIEMATPSNLKEFETTIENITQCLNIHVFVKKIGIGIAGIIKNNKVVSATNIKYLKNLDFQKLLNTQCLMVVDNDARCYARAEYMISTNKNTKSMLVITIGTGIGRAYGKNGKILKIRRFEYAEEWEKDYQKIQGKKALAKFLREKLNLLINALNPEIVVLGGGVIDKKGYFEVIKNQLSSAGVTKLKIRRSKMGKFSGAIGAAMLHG